MEENEKVESKEPKISLLELTKRTILNKFYIEFISYFIILMLGLLLSSVIYANASINTQIIGGFVVLFIVSVLMYILGYIIANKRKGLNKYFPAFLIFILILFIYIIDNIFNCSSSTSLIPNFIYNIDYMIISLHSIIFKWLEIAFRCDVPDELFVLYVPFILFLGMRRNRLNEMKKTERRKQKELVK